MIRVLVFFALLFAVTLGFAWIADLPGMVSVSWNGYVWEQPPVTVAVVGGIFLVLFLIAVAIIRLILNSPKLTERFLKRRRKDKGYTALSHGLIALATGNAKLARRHGLDADRFLAEEPATKLLLAQTAQLAGKDAEARERFEAMLENDETRALGLHGLFVEAERHSEPVAARHYAEEAAKAAPGLEWAGKAVLGYQAVAGDWDDALQTLERNYTAKHIDKKTYRRRRAVILTALSLREEDSNPERAFALAKEAHGLAQDLVPAAIVTSRLATRRGDIRKAAKSIEATWRLSPHPDLAETYAHVRSGDSAVDRLKRVKALSGQRPNTAVGAIAIAKAAMEAREFEEARAQLKKVLQSEPTRGAFVLMAELEEAEHGDQGRMRDWLARAVRAPLDKAWVGDGIVTGEWRPVSPVTGKLDVFEWTTPSEASDRWAGEVLEDSLFDAPALAPAAPGADVQDGEAAETAPEAPAPTVAEPDDVLDLTAEPAPEHKLPPILEDAAPEKAEASTPVPRETQPPQEPAATAPLPSRSGFEGTTDDVAHTPPLQALPDTPESVRTGSPQPEPENAEASDPDPVSADPSASAPEEAKPEAAPPEEDKTVGPADKDLQAEEADTGTAKPAKKAPRDLKQPIEFALARMPDDPGPTEEEAEKEAVRAPRPRFFN